MDRNSYSTPMDFDYDNQRGPVDENSPFITHTRHAPRQQKKPSDLPLSWRIQQQTDLAKSSQKRPYSQFNSPLKSQASAFPSLRPAHGQTTLFSDIPLSRQTQEQKPLPPNPPVDNWKTPRKIDIDFSSGGETPDTVDHNADNEATPDTSINTMGLRKKMSNLLSSSNSKSKPATELAIVKGSPGRGEIVRPYSHKAEKRVTKRRIAFGKRAKQHNEGDDESETDAGAREKRVDRSVSGSHHQEDQQQTSLIASFFSFLEKHPHLPHLLSFYAQLLLNLFWIFGIMFIGYSFWSTIRSDVDEKSQAAKSEILHQIAGCTRDFYGNKCEAYRVPAMELVCNEWEKCMKRDANLIGRARVSAHTFAEIFNSFIEPISYKAMIFTLMVLFGCIAASNVAFGFFRNKALHEDPYMTRQMHAPPPSSSISQRHPSANFDQYASGGYQNPYGINQPQWDSQRSLEPAPSPSRSSPRKHLEFH